MELDGIVDELTMDEIPDGLKLRIASSISGHGILGNPESPFYDTAVMRHRFDHFTAYSVVNHSETAIQRNADDKYVFHSESGKNENKIKEYLQHLAEGLGSWEAQKSSYEGSSPDFVYRFDNILFPERGRNEPLQPDEQREIGIIAEQYFNYG